MWTEADASANLEELLRRAQSGDPQIIGEHEPCVVIGLDEYLRLTRQRIERPNEEPHRPGDVAVDVG